eukprot:TRINITY_DN3089_c0_g1_i2.p1 TRINITY_DN3089_c0_g1~~TRINITY_DN3089_c0_g1_i2.p1  ORF type:complete len:1382 (+),score=228.85 TRINITY_DN3089_c0_g1_i2:356-4501(+)
MSSPGGRTGQYPGTTSSAKEGSAATSAHPAVRGASPKGPERKPSSLDRKTLSRVTEEVSQITVLRNLSRQLVHKSCDDLDGVVAIEEARVVHLEAKDLCDISLLEECRLLEFCFLQNNFLFKIDALKSCVNLQKLDLSGNKIQLLPRGDFWKGFQQLQVLNLHDNQISSMKSLEGLLSLPAVTAMTLYNNPIADHPQYRALIVNSLATLKAFDGYVISDAEVIQGGNFGERYTTKSASFKLDEFVYTNGDYRHHLAQMKEELQNIFQVYFKRSPVVLIQRTMRGLMVRLKLKALRRKRKEAAVRIQRRWLKGMLSRYLPDDNKGGKVVPESFNNLDTNIGIMKLHKAAIRVQRWRREALQRRKGQHREWAARVLQRCWRRTYNVRVEFKAFMKSNRVRHILFTPNEAEAMRKVIRRARTQLEKIDPTRPAASSQKKADQVLFRYTNHHIIKPAKSWIIGDDGCAKQPGLLVGTSKFNRPVTEIGNLHRMRLGVNSSDFDMEVLEHLPRRATFVGSRSVSAYWRSLRKYASDVVERSMGSVETRLHVTNPRPDEPQYYMQFYIKNPTLYGLIMQGVAVWNSKVLRHRSGDDDLGKIRLTPITDHEYSRLAAAIAIQSSWRAYKTVARIDPPLSRRLLIHRAVLTLQCWWRRKLAQWRRSFLQRIKDLVREVDSRDLFIDAQAYEDLNDPDVFKPRTLFPEHGLQFNITSSNITQLIDNDFEYLGLPLWPHCRAPTIRGDQLGETIGRMDTFALVSVNTVIDDAKDLDIPTIDKPLLRVRFSSVFEARLRAVLLFISTYDPASGKSKARLFTTKSLYQWETETLLNGPPDASKARKGKRKESAAMMLEETEKPNNFYEAGALVQALGADNATEQANVVRAKINPTPDALASAVQGQADEMTLTGMTPFLDLQMPLDKEAHTEDKKWAATQQRRFFDTRLIEKRTAELKEQLKKKDDRRRATPKLVAQMRSHAKKEYTRQLTQIQKAEAKYNAAKQQHIEENKKRVALQRQKDKERKETLALKRQFAKRDLRQKARTDRINMLYKVSEAQQKLEEEREERMMKTQRERSLRATSRQDKKFHNTFARHQNLISQQLRSGERLQNKEELQQRNRDQVDRMKQERSQSRARQQSYTLEKLHTMRVKAATSKAEIKARLISRNIHEEQEWQRRRENIQARRAKTRASHYQYGGYQQEGEDNQWPDEDYANSDYILRARTATGGSRGGRGTTADSLPPLGAGGDPNDSLTTRWERIQQSPLSSFSLIDHDLVPGDPGATHPPRAGRRRPHTQASPRFRGLPSGAGMGAHDVQDSGSQSGFSARDARDISVTDWENTDDSASYAAPDNGILAKTEPKGFHGSARPRMHEPKTPVAMRGSGTRAKFLLGNK